MSMGISNISYQGVGADGREITEYRAWNPGGYGCSRLCDGCWAHASCHRSKCPDCRAFRVHLHPERLDWPVRRKRPSLILCQFTGDSADQHRTPCEIADFLGAALRAPWHNYVWLTRNPYWLSSAYALIRRGPRPPNWWVGTTITGDKGNYSAVVDLLRVSCRHRWISAEPLHCPANFALWLIGSHVDELGITVTNSPNFAGVVIGQDNRSGAPGTLGLGNVRQLVEDCKATGTPVFVKQLWIRGQLVRNPDHFPPDLRLRNLPWSMPEEHGLLCYGAATDDEGD